MVGTITESEYNAALKRKFQAESPFLESLQGTKEEVDREIRRINGYKSKIKQSESQIKSQKALRDQLIVDAVSAGEAVTTVAWAAGVARDTVYKILKRVDNTE